MCSLLVDTTCCTFSAEMDDRQGRTILGALAASFACLTAVFFMCATISKLSLKPACKNIGTTVPLLYLVLVVTGFGLQRLDLLIGITFRFVQTNVQLLNLGGEFALVFFPFPWEHSLATFPTCSAADSPASTR